MHYIGVNKMLKRVFIIFFKQSQTEPCSYVSTVLIKKVWFQEHCSIQNKKAQSSESLEQKSPARPGTSLLFP